MKRLRFVILISIIAVVTAACGAPDAGDDTTTTAAATPTTSGNAEATTTAAGGAETTAPTAAGCDEPIRIGVLQPLTGGLAASGTDAKDGFELYWACPLYTSPSPRDRTS